MKDNEITKALECCSCKPSKCNDCPCMQTGECFEVGKYAIDLINRQKAEISVLRKLLDKAETEMNNQSENIKKLTEDCYSIQSTLAKMSMGVAETRNEAIKEFADLAIKAICEKVSAPTPTESYIVEKCIEAIDNLVKEMVGKG